VEYLLGHLNRSITKPLAKADILSTYAGYRPLLRLRHARTPARLSRTHAVVQGTSGLISVSGGKMTTYRVMARDAVDRIDAREGGARPCVTANLTLAGGVGWPEASSGLAGRGARLGLDPATLAHLFASLGTLAAGVLDLVERDAALAERLDPELPAIRAEALYAARAEAALTVGDVLARRLRLDLESADHGTGAAPETAALLAAALGWDAERREGEVRRYAAYAEQRNAGLRSPAERTPELTAPSD
jgi:glycerol-3-phosphate dehydrogenase